VTDFNLSTGCLSLRRLFLDEKWRLAIAFSKYLVGSTFTWERNSRAEQILTGQQLLMQPMADPGELTRAWPHSFGLQSSPFGRRRNCCIRVNVSKKVNANKIGWKSVFVKRFSPLTLRTENMRHKSSQWLKKGHQNFFYFWVNSKEIF